jgi:hypothetical protein
VGAVVRGGREQEEELLQPASGQFALSFIHMNY